MADRIFKEFCDFWKESDEPDKSPLRNNKLICPIVVSSCNGTGDWSFSDATIEYSQVEGCTMTFWFMTAVNFVHSELLHEKKKMNHLQKKAYDCLLKFVSEIDRHRECLWNGMKTEAEVCGILAVHLFGPLMDYEYMTDGRSKQCCKCQKDIKSGDTSLGDSRIWHGKANILLKNSVVKVDDSPVLASRIENNTGTLGEQISLEEIDDDPVFNPGCSSKKISEVLAQTIVNAFCCVKINKSLSNLFIPSFLANGSEVSIYMYNCDQDKLLASENLPLWKYGDANEYTLNMNTVLYIWMAIYFDIFETHITDRLQEYFPCCKFKATVGKEIYDIYKNGCSKPMEDGVIPVQSESDLFVVNPLIQIPATCIDEYKKMTDILKERFESSN